MPTIEVAYDPNAPLPQRFIFSTGRQRHILIDDDPTTVKVSLTGGKFPSSPADALLWSVTPPGVQVVRGTSPDDPDTTLLIQNLPQPASYLTPWAFQLNIDDDPHALIGISAPLFFLARPPASPAQETTSLTYSPADGSFTLHEVVTLVHEQLLINAILPFTISISISEAIFSNVAPEGFNPTPVVWDSGSPPAGVVTSFDVGQPDTLTITIYENASGTSAGFRVAIEHEGNQILSPDPILVNATLGDGNG